MKPAAIAKPVSVTPLPRLRTCQFILDKGPWVLRPPQWCGKPTPLESVYCEEHYKICHTTQKHWKYT